MSCFLFLWVLFIWKACLLGPGPFQALLPSALLRQNPASGLWTGPPACWLPPPPSATGPGGPSLLAPSHQARTGSRDPSPGSSEAARRPPCSPGTAAWKPLRIDLPPPAQASALIISFLCLTARAGPAGAPDPTGELSDTEALSSPSLGPKPGHQQVFHHPNPRAQPLMPMVTRQQSPGERTARALLSVKSSSPEPQPLPVTVMFFRRFYFAQIHFYSK